MTDLSNLIADLSPEQRELFLLRLNELNRERPDTSSQQSIPKRADANSYPISFAQQRMWFIEQLDPGTSAYNISTAIRLTGPLNIAALELSINRVMERHESLRATFTTVNGTPVQVIHSQLHLTLHVVDWSELAEAEREARIRQAAIEEASSAFDLQQGPLVRATLLRLGAEEYVALLTMHHIVSDGWSLGLLVQEIGAFYEALTNGRPPALAELSIQYSDFAAWQRQWLQGEVLDEQLGYWKKQLSGDLPALELPHDRPRPPLPSFRGALHPIRVPAALVQRLERLNREEGTTLFMVVLAAFQTLLYRYTQQDDILVGSPIANRNRIEIENLIGFFANTLVLRTDLSGNPTFRELLQRVRDVAHETYAHQDVPFEMVVEAVQPTRDLSYNRLFQVVFVLQNAPMERMELPGLVLNPIPIHNGTAKFDLMLQLGEDAAGLVGSFEYSTDLFDAATIARLAEHFQTLLESISTQPDRPIADLSLLPVAEQHQLLIEWNETQADYLESASIPQLFEAQVARTPNTVAVVFENQTLTYRELNEQANQLAHHLHTLGVGPDTRVVICVERSVAMVTAVLGVLKSGGAYLPLDPAYPAERLAFMLADSRAPVVLTQTSLVPGLPEYTGHIVCLDTDWAALSHNSVGQHNPIATAAADNLAYVIYTSGSTGRPKGVAMTHRPLVNLITWQLKNATLAPAKALQFASLSFDVSFQEIFSTWCAGGTLFLTSEDTRHDPLLLLRLLVAQGIERLFLPYVALQQLAETAIQQKIYPTALGEIITAGEQLRITPSIARFFEELKGCRLENQYGPSESHVVTAFSLEGGSQHWPVLPPIGRPIANTQIYVLDAKSQPVPVDVPGELYIGGVNLARGYLDRPELTAERFIPHPFGSAARLYKTGDRARFRADGTLEFLGRVDHQVKIRGFRIELSEIEIILRRHPDIREAVAVVHADPSQEGRPAEQRLVAYLVADPDHVPAVSEVQNFLKERLPGYMVPSAYVMLDALPLTPSGKINRRALPVPTNERSDANAIFVAPRDPFETALADIWGEVLHLEQMSVHDNFFELGGHSLLATQVLSRIRDSFQVELPVRILFEVPTLAALAERIKAIRQGREGMSLDPILPVEHALQMPLSFAQQRLWFLYRLDPSSPAYNVPVALRVQGSLQVKRLELAVGEMVRRHETLRTTFSVVEGQSVQVIAAKPEAGRVPIIPLVDLQSLPKALQEVEVQRLISEEALQTFDLVRGPLLRAKLLRLAETEHVAFFTMHHIIADGWSLGVFIQEIMALYEAFSHQRSSPLPELAIQYVDFVQWQRQWFQASEVWAAQLSYWKRQLRNSPPALLLPTDRPRPALQTFQGAVQSLTLSRDLAESLKELSRQAGATLFMTLLAAFQTLLHRYTGQEDILVGTAIANRNRAETEGLIGFFVNTLVLRTDLSGDPTFRALLDRVREVALGAYTHQDLPFEKLIEELQPERDLSRTPLFQVMFDFQNAPRPALELSDLKLIPLKVNYGTAKFDLALFMEETGQSLSATFEYNLALFDAATMTRLLAHFQTLLEDIVAQPDQHLSELTLLSEAEAHQLLVDWNETATDYPPQCGHQLFEAQVEHTPDAIAVVFEGQVLTYSELNRRANQIAHYLQDLGAGPEVCIGLCMEHSLERIVALLGILKVGAVYVPLDPMYPKERLAFMLEDVQARWLLTQVQLLARLPATAAQLICLDTDWEKIARQNTENLDQPVTAENAAYLIYTSGSTGKPKGAVIPHRGIGNLALAQIRLFDMDATSRVLQFASFSFDASISEVFTTLLAGATLCLGTKESLLPGAALLHLLRTEAITTVTFPPAVLAALPESSLPALRTVISAGESCSGEQVARWSTQHRVINAYGPTEATVCATATICQAKQRKPPIGRPIANVEIYILDNHHHPVPIGVPGELYIASVGLARGYLNRPDLTAQTFVPNPILKMKRGMGKMKGSHLDSSAQYPAYEQRRVYRTGDLARYLPDGNIEFLGRVDHQVKVRGYRIELSEIEAVLGQFPGVSEAIVMTWEQAPGDKRLVAYVVPRAGQPLVTSELRSFLKEQLPDYMLPAAYITLAALPLSPNGKVDRKALPAPDQSRPDLEAHFVAPLTPTEKELAEIWVGLLSIKQIGVHDNFFDLGGHSLLATQLMSQIQSQFGLELPLRECFMHPTIKGLAEIIESAMLTQMNSTKLEEVLDLLEKMDETEARNLMQDNQDRQPAI
ncbi:nonribosomal peptide synthetase DhbF [Thermoflexales bacterium]|nr:nonribosomal peptide synthetase DhbF [Thermoflexales bacterium]